MEEGLFALPVARYGGLLLSLTLLISLLGCGHHLRYEGVGSRDEPWGDPIVQDKGDLAITMSDTPFTMSILFERTTSVEQDYRTSIEATEVYLPWSPRALLQFAFMSWNPIAWCFPSLWSEDSGHDHSRFHDWLTLWNPFVCAGGDVAEARTRRVNLRHTIQRRDLGERRLPLNRHIVRLTMRAGDEVERRVLATDLNGLIQFEFSDLPAAFRTQRPIRLEAEIDERGRQTAELF